MLLGNQAGCSCQVLGHMFHFPRSFHAHLQPSLQEAIMTGNFILSTAILRTQKRVPSLTIAGHAVSMINAIQYRSMPDQNSVIDPKCGSIILNADQYRSIILNADQAASDRALIGIEKY